jgi:hypothetical protein
VTPPSAAETTPQIRDPLGHDADPDEILRHLRAATPPSPPTFHVNRQGLSPPDPRWERPQLVPIEQAMAVPPPALPPALQRTRPDQVANAMHVIQTARAVAAITATRMLLLLVLVCAAGLWAVTILDPVPYRITSVAIFTATVLWPLVGLALRKG